MKVVGLTGGVGCGKTTIARILETHFSMKVIYADEIAKEQMEPDGVCYQSVVDEFGEEILDSSGNIDKKKLSKLIFSDSSLRHKLNSIIHPKVKGYILDEIEQLKEFGAFKGVFIEAALILEAGYKEFLDEIWYVHAGEEERIDRLLKQRLLTEDEIKSIMASQCSEDDFYQNADRVIENGNQVTIKEMLEQILSYVESWNEAE